MKEKNNEIRSLLLVWFAGNKRPLPWRETKNPYHIWLSEIMLQQTRVAQVMPYYQQFTENFVAVKDLADAEEQDVLKLWQGLGYYSRARNLHATAKIVSEQYNGRFPDNYEEIIKLKGIGDYTASAILSIAFGLPFAVLDGNVYRVLARLFLIETPINAPAAKNIFKKLAQELLDKNNPGDFNEAMMEFGATICIPKNPLCHICPLAQNCDALATGKINELPQKLPARKTRARYFHYLIIRKNNGIYIKERLAGDIWQGLYDFPVIEKDSAGPLNKNDIKNGIHIWHDEKMLPVFEIKHQLTHQTLHISFYETDAELNENALVFVPLDALQKYPVPKPVEIFLKKYLQNKNLL